MNVIHCGVLQEDTGPIVDINDHRYLTGRFDLDYVLDQIIHANFELMRNTITLRIDQSDRRDVHEWIRLLQREGIEQLRLDLCEQIPFLIHGDDGVLSGHQLVHDQDESIYYHLIDITFAQMELLDKSELVLPVLACCPDHEEVHEVVHLRLVKG